MTSHPILEALADEATIAGGSAGGYALRDSLGLLTNVAARLFARGFNERMQAHGASIGYWPVLLCLWREDGPSQAELCRRIAVEAPTLTRTLDRMGRDGLVERRRNPADRREIRVFLTPKGQALRDVLLPEAMMLNQEAVAGLPDEDVQALRRMLRHVIGRLLERDSDFTFDDDCCEPPR